MKPSSAHFHRIAGIMPRALSPYAAILCLGATTTLMVSWACSMWINVVDSQEYSMRLTGVSVPCSLVVRKRSLGSEAYEEIDLIEPLDPLLRSTDRQQDRSRLPKWSRFHALIPVAPDGSPRIRVDVARGWPLRAMMYTMDAGWDFDQVLNPVKVRAGWVVGRFSRGSELALRVLPTRPIIIGFVGNTLCVSVVFLVILILSRIIIRRGRLLRGRCPICNYDLLHLSEEGCPECGWLRPSPRSLTHTNIQRAE